MAATTPTGAWWTARDAAQHPGDRMILRRRRVLGAVLCGGSSTRMGHDKALLGPARRPLAARVVAALRDAAVDEVVLVGGDGRALRLFADGWVADDHPGAGPLGGLSTVARRRPGSALLVCACDLPDIEGDDLTPLLESIAPTEAPEVDAGGTPPDVVVYEVDGIAQWSALGITARAATRAATAFDAGERSLHRALRVPELHLRRLRPERPEALRDADRPDDLPAELRGSLPQRG